MPDLFYCIILVIMDDKEIKRGKQFLNNLVNLFHLNKTFYYGATRVSG